jgi:hypothetical protein
LTVKYNTAENDVASPIDEESTSAGIATVAREHQRWICHRDKAPVAATATGAMMEFRLEF